MLKQIQLSSRGKKKKKKSKKKSIPTEKVLPSFKTNLL